MQALSKEIPSAGLLFNVRIAALEGLTSDVKQQATATLLNGEKLVT